MIFHKPGRNHRSFLRACIVVSMLATVLYAQSPTGNWDYIKTLSPFTEVRVKCSGMATVNSQVRSVTDDALVLESSKGTETLSRRQIDSISVRKNGSRARKALIGLGVGAVAGLVVGIGSAHCVGVCPQYGGLKTAVIGGGAVIGAAIGSAVGALMPTGSWVPVYKR